MTTCRRCLADASLGLHGPGNCAPPPGRDQECERCRYRPQNAWKPVGRDVDRDRGLRVRRVRAGDGGASVVRGEAEEAEEAVTFARLRKIWNQKCMSRWAAGSDPMWVRTYGESRSKHGKAARLRKEQFQYEDSCHRRARDIWR